MKGARKAMRKFKAYKKALQYKLARDSGGGAREQERRKIGGFWTQHHPKFQRDESNGLR